MFSCPFRWTRFLLFTGSFNQAEAAAIHAEQFNLDPDSYLPTTRSTVEVGQLIPASVYVHARRLKRRLRAEMLEIFADADCLIAPTSSDQAPRLGNRSALPLGDPSFQSVWTCFGLPNLTFPTTLGKERLPHAIQLIGRPSTDFALLRVGSWCEKAFDQLPSPLQESDDATENT